MKRLIFICIFSFLFYLIACPTAYAHGGNTDWQGGHYDYDAGEYHYHHGYPPHQHTDGTCPYDFDDRTGWNSGSGGGGNDTESIQNATTGQPPVSMQEERSMIMEVWMGVMIAFLILWLFLSKRAARRQYQTMYGDLQATLKQGAEQREIISQLKKEQQMTIVSLNLDHLRIVAQLKAQLRESEDLLATERQRSKFLSLYRGRSALEVANLSPDVSVGEDGLPKELCAEKWGKRFTFYISRSGKTFHAKRECTLGAYLHVNAADMRHMKKRIPCSKCKPQLPDLEWYDRYKQIRAIMEKYKICDFDEMTADSDA